MGFGWSFKEIATKENKIQKGCNNQNNPNSQRMCNNTERPGDARQCGEDPPVPGAQERRYPKHQDQAMVHHIMQ